MMYRIVYHLVDISSCHLTPTISVRGYNMKFQVPYARISLYKKSLFPETIRLWNSLLQTVVSCSTIDSFKQEVQALRHRRLVLDVLTAMYIDTSSLDFTFALVVPAPPTRQYDDTPDDGVSTILGEEEEEYIISDRNRA